MIYKDFKGEKLSALGFGTMRMPLNGTGPEATVDETQMSKMVAYAIEHGVNYFDTAYSYHRFESEHIIGRILKQYPRTSFHLATKFPGHAILPTYEPERIFEEQLVKCGVDYFDFYMLHNVYENSIKTYLNPKWGIVDYLLEQKKAGQIHHLGFSAHGRAETIRQFLDVYGDKMEFGQIELNYLDWKLQDAKAKYELLTERGLPVWVMEPVRGGGLAKLSAENEAKLKAVRPDESIPAWAFRWLQALQNVKIVLSGMSNMQQVEDNIETFSAGKPLNTKERKLLEGVAASMMDMLPCTACRYCCTECPKKLDIPMLLSLYNECRFEPALTVSMNVDALAPEQRPSACIGCGNCKKVCPQGIDIPEAMKTFQAILEKLPHWEAMGKDMRYRLQGRKTMGHEAS